MAEQGIKELTLRALNGALRLIWREIDKIRRRLDALEKE